MPRIQLMDGEDVHAALARIFREERVQSRNEDLREIERAARPLRFADAWLKEDVASDYLGIAERTLADMRRAGVPFDTRERHRRHWYRRVGPVMDGRGSLESYVSGEIGPGDGSEE